MRILFGIMSAVQPADTVASLVDALGPDHPVMVHHDWSQQPDFRLRRPNLTYVEQPERTGWANWGFSRGILKLVAEAVAREQFDYFQLLSPTCLPIRPMADFAAHLAETRADLYVDSIRLDSEPLVLMSHGWRAYAAEGSLRQRVLRRSRRWYLGHPPQMENRVGLSIPSSSLMNGTPWEALKARTGLAITRLAQKRIGFDHPFSQEFPCYVGSTWFTASQRGCEYMLQKASDATLTAYFARMHMGDEIFFPTIFSNSGLTRACAPHYIARFDNARPTWLQIDDLDEVLSSKLFFARKFPVDPQSPVRLELRRRLDWPRASTGKPARESA